MTNKYRSQKRGGCWWYQCDKCGTVSNSKPSIVAGNCHNYSTKEKKNKGRNKNN